MLADDLAKGKEKKITVMTPEDLVKYMDENIAKRRFHNYTHAYLYALQRLKDADDEQALQTK